MIDDSTRRRFVAGVASVRAVTLSGCLGGRSDDTGSSGTSGEIGGTAETTATVANVVRTVGDDARERLDGRLVGLVEADDWERYARRREVSVEGGRVLVTVELRSGGTLPATPPVAVDRRHGSLVEGWVDVDDLPSLASADAVASVRPPREPVVDGTAASLPGGT